MIACRTCFIAVTLILIGAISLPIVAASAAPREPGAFIEDLGKRAIILLSDKKATLTEQRTGFRALLREGFATRAIGYFVIGKYRRGTSRETVNEFVKTFENYVIELYSSQFKNYSGETFKVIRVIKTNRPSDSIVITNILRDGGKKIFKIAFQIRQRPNKPSKIIDLKIEGVSMILAQREEFTGFISRNGGKLQALIDVLKTRIQKLRNKASNDATKNTARVIPKINSPKRTQDNKKEEREDNEEEQD